MWVRSLVFCLSWVVIAAVGEADEDRAVSTTLRLWVEYYQEVASGYDIRLQSAPDERLAVSAKPVLVYSNPTIGYDTHGAIFVWTRNGRAEAIAAIWSKRIGADSKSLKNVNHEFHSLANESLTARGTDGVVWSPSKPGLDFRLIPDAPEPAESRAGRLAQMRQISRDFTGFDLNPREEGSTEEVERELRVLAKPLYRYEEIDRKSDKDARTNAFEDGAVFGLFLDWDPEILLVLETRPTASGPRWHYAVAHVDYKPLRLQYQSRDVWSKPEKNFGRPDHKYYCVIGVAKRPVELE